MNASGTRVLVGAVVVGLVASPASAVSITTLSVGDLGNAGELSGGPSGGYGPYRICGAVDYTYNIGKYEVTAGQYCEFLTKVAATDTYGLYNTDMANTEYGSGISRSGSSGSYTYSLDAAFVNRPVNYVSYWDACRFVNWLQNGQPTGAQGPGTTETGAYTLDGYNGENGGTIQRNADAHWVLPTEDEWYKAAYYKGGSTNAGYFDYPTSSDPAPGQDMADASGNNANFYTAPYAYPLDPPYYTTMGGEFQNSASPCGTFDQGGNVFEWNEFVYLGAVISTRGLRGGSFSPEPLANTMQAAYRGDGGSPSAEAINIGFRVAEVPSVSIVSRKTHVGAGDFDIDVSDPGTVESRKNGATQLVATFDRAIQRLGGTVADVQVSQGTVTSLSVDGAVLGIGLSGAVGPQALTVSFPGIADAADPAVLLNRVICFRVLPGDASGDGTVNTSDYVAVRGRIGQPVSASNCRNDVNADGVINTSDYISIRGKIGTTASSCP